MPLDLRTLAFTVSLVSFTATILMVFLYLLVRQYHATLYWAVGNALVMISFVLLTKRGEVPDFVSILIANLLSASSLVITYFGILNFVNFQRKLSPAFWLLLLLLPVFVYFSLINKSLLYRSLITAIFSAAIFLLNGFTLFLLSPKTLKFSHWFTGAGFVIMGFFQIFRGFAVFFVNTSYGIFSENWLQAAFFIISVAFMILWTMGSVFMVTQRLSVELTQTARIDYLTKTLNRRAGQERLDQEAKRAERRNSVFSIILMDVDHFKQINDYYGHSAGDATLIQISDLMRSTLRAEDMHCRWGGDEFLIMLEDTAEVGALEVAERLKKTISKTKVFFLKKKISCSLSFGVACYGITSRNLEETVSQADEALYLAKSKGGNCIVVESVDKNQLVLL